eukprot:scaffold2021_cov176-Amphora_coffeaeformis.AAC.10
MPSRLRMARLISSQSADRKERSMQAKVPQDWHSQSPQKEQGNNSEPPLHTQAICDTRHQRERGQEEKVEAHFEPNFVTSCHDGRVRRKDSVNRRAVNVESPTGQRKETTRYNHCTPHQGLRSADILRQCMSQTDRQGYTHTKGNHKGNRQGL